MGQAQQDDATSGTSGDHQAAFVQVREQLTDLDASIVALREEADRLLESAAARTVLTVVHSEPAVELDVDPAPGAPVWPQLDSYEPQHGPAQLDDGSFGARSGDPGEEDATVLEFARPAQSTEAETAEDPAEQPTPKDDPESGSSGMPADWNTASEDDAAIEKFFSAEVEPEPAQRWLLNE